MFKISLPIPPSVNRLYRNGGKGGRARYKQKGYLKWEQEANDFFRDIAPPYYTERVNYDYVFYPKNKTFGDIENYLKALTDMLVKQQIMKDDKHTILIKGEFRLGGYDKENPRVDVTVRGR